MNKKSFTDSLSDEVLSKIIDDTLNFKKTSKNKNIKENLFKIIPAAVMIALVIGLVNILPVFLNSDTDNNGIASNTNEIASSENIYTPAVDQSDLFLPNAIEKSFFETKILTAVTDKSALNKIRAYFSLKDSAYVLDAVISKREKEQILEYLREYTDITYNDMMQMCIDNGISLPKTVDPAYAHVRFGNDENTLLLDVEWYTYETYVEEVVEPAKKQYNEWYYEFIESDAYIKMSDEERERVDERRNEFFENCEENASQIKDKILYSSRTINGKSNALTGGVFLENLNDLDSNGYYIFKVFPISGRGIGYWDENGEWQSKGFNGGTDKNGCPISINSQSNYENVLKNKIIPFCDDLLERGLINQDEYNEYTIPNLLDYYIDLYFN